VRPEDRITEMRQMSPTTGFGETFQYSNYLAAAGGFAAAHSFAPDLSLADAYDRAMRQLVFEPLGMKQTSVLCIKYFGAKRLAGFFVYRPQPASA
jgi:CubicO group peptidase (beta-lactamase class C family)